MTNTELAVLAHRAGFGEKTENSIRIEEFAKLKAFAELVRADEREENARVCEKVAVDYYTRISREHEPYMKATAEDCAMQIRARGQA
jgi:hypothetical protein